MTKVLVDEMSSAADCATSSWLDLGRAHLGFLDQMGTIIAVNRDRRRVIQGAASVLTNAGIV